MRWLAIRWIVNAVALFVTVQLIPGIRFDGSLGNLAALAAVFGIFNAVLRPILVLLTCPLIMLTLGLFALAINGILLWFTASVSDSYGLGLHVNGVLPAFLGGLMMGLISVLVGTVIRPHEPRDDRD